LCTCLRRVRSESSRRCSTCIACDDMSLALRANGTRVCASVDVCVRAHVTRSLRNVELSELSNAVLSDIKSERAAVQAQQLSLQSTSYAADVGAVASGVAPSAASVSVLAMPSAIAAAATTSAYATTAVPASSERRIRHDSLRTRSFETGAPSQPSQSLRVAVLASTLADVDVSASAGDDDASRASSDATPEPATDAPAPPLAAISPPALVAAASVPDVSSTPTPVRARATLSAAPGLGTSAIGAGVCVCEIVVKCCDSLCVVCSCVAEAVGVRVCVCGVRSRMYAHTVSVGI
jgi:hypothetical protein